MERPRQQQQQQSGGAPSGLGVGGGGDPPMVTSSTGGVEEELRRPIASLQPQLSHQSECEHKVRVAEDWIRVLEQEEERFRVRRAAPAANVASGSSNRTVEVGTVLIARSATPLLSEDVWTTVFEFLVPGMDHEGLFGKVARKEIVTLVLVSKDWRGRLRTNLMLEGRRLLNLLSLNQANGLFSELLCVLPNTTGLERKDCAALHLNFAKACIVQMGIFAESLGALAMPSQFSYHARRALGLAVELASPQLQAQAVRLQAVELRIAGRHTEAVHSLKSAVALDPGADEAVAALADARKCAMSAKIMTIRVNVRFERSNPETPSSFELTIPSDTSMGEFYKQVIRNESRSWGIESSHLHIKQAERFLLDDVSLANNELENGDELDIFLEQPDPRGRRSRDLANTELEDGNDVDTTIFLE